MTTKGFIFDLDGVIVDTAKYHFLAWKDLASSLGIPFTEAQNEQLKGVSRVESLNKILTWGNVTMNPEQFSSLMNEKNKAYLTFIDQMTEDEILPGVVHLLDKLLEMGQKIALGSASKNAKLILEKVNLLGYFDCIVDGNHVSKAKHDPEVFLRGASGLGLEATQCVVFEDAVAGIKAANAAQMISIGIGKSEYLYEADLVLVGLDHLSDVLLTHVINASSKNSFKINIK